MSTFGSFSSGRPYQIWTGAVARAVHGERLTMALIDAAKMWGYGRGLLQRVFEVSRRD